MKKTMALLLAVVMALSLVGAAYGTDPVSGDTPEAAETDTGEDTPEATETDTEEDTPEAAETDTEEDTPEAAETDTEEDTPEAAETDTVEDTPEAAEIITEENTPEAAEIITEENTPEAAEIITEEDDAEDGATVYSVDIAWTVTPAEYTSAGDTYTWDPDTLQYVKDPDRLGDTLTQKKPGTVSITVTNNSEAAVAYSIDYTSAASGDNGEISEVSTDSPASGNLNAAETATYTATVQLKQDDKGEYIATQAAAGNLTMGTYTVTIKDKISFNWWVSVGGTVSADTTYECEPGLTFYEWYSSADVTLANVQTVSGITTKDGIATFVTSYPDSYVCYSYSAGLYHHIFDNKADHNDKGTLCWNTELTDGMIIGFYQAASGNPNK